MPMWIQLLLLYFNTNYDSGVEICDITVLNVADRLQVASLLSDEEKTRIKASAAKVFRHFH